MIGCVTALTKTTKENGATVAIPESHLWDQDRRPLEEEAVPAELDPGDAFIFLGNLYHGGGANVTKYVLVIFNNLKLNSTNNSAFLETIIEKPLASFFANRRCGLLRISF